MMAKTLVSTLPVTGIPEWPRYFRFGNPGPKFTWSSRGLSHSRAVGKRKLKAPKQRMFNAFLTDGNGDFQAFFHVKVWNHHHPIDSKH